MSILTEILLVPLYWLLEIVYFVFRCRPRKPISGQHVLITGAAQGIGAAFARQFATMGNTVHCVDMNSELLETTVGELRKQGYRAHSYTCDLSNVADVERMCGEVKRSCGDGKSISVLVNNAGVLFWRQLTQLTLSQIQHAVTVNLISNLWLIKEFLPDMLHQDRGFVINVASTAGLIPGMRATDYAVAKAGCVHTIPQLAHLHCDSNLNFTAVCPGFVQTKMIHGLEGFLKCISPEEVASAAIRAAQEGREILVLPMKWWYYWQRYRCIPARVFRAITASASNVIGQIVQEHYVGQEMHKKIQ